MKEKMDDMRVRLKTIGAELMEIKHSIGEEETPTEMDLGEVMANLTLAYRHIEDASMRCGKVIQFSEGGKSPYDKNVVGSPE